MKKNNSIEKALAEIEKEIKAIEVGITKMRLGLHELDKRHAKLVEARESLAPLTGAPAVKIPTQAQINKIATITGKREYKKKEVGTKADIPTPPTSVGIQARLKKILTTYEERWFTVTELYQQLALQPGAQPEKGSLAKLVKEASQSQAWLREYAIQNRRWYSLDPTFGGKASVPPGN